MQSYIKKSFDDNYIKIKICGITNLEDALYCSSLGVDAIGFVCTKSPRKVSMDKLEPILKRVPAFITTVGVFVNESMGFIQKVLRDFRLNVVQLHGDETPQFCKELKKKVKVIKAIRIGDDFRLDRISRYNVDALLLDTYSRVVYGGTGRAFDWDVAKKIKKLTKMPIILAGGLNPDNVASAIKFVRPYAVDVSSGVEKCCGKKDYSLVKDFVERVRNL